MKKEKIAFIDHPFHKKTRSSNFFIDVLKDEYDLHTFFLGVDPRSTIEEIADSDYDLVICWQTEFCAPYFLMRGKRVVCIPMFDGVENAPSWYWLAMRQARFINFCQDLHRKHRSLGIESIYVQYFGGSKLDIKQASFESLKGIFWQRRPNEGLDYRFARSVLGDVVDSIHIHNAPDIGDATDWQPPFGFTVSLFGKDSRNYRSALEEANIFLAPRKTEGIGHPLIEAMARGMCVIAHDKPTANEYIVDGVNGILIDYDKPHSFKELNDPNSKKFLTKERAEEFGKQARAFYEHGRKEWLRDVEFLPYFVGTTPVADLSTQDVSFAEDYLSIVRFAHLDFYRFLHKLLKLQSRGYLGKEASTIRIREQLHWRIKAIPGARATWAGLRAIKRKLS